MDAVTCRFHSGPKPSLVIEFSPDIHPANVREISNMVLKAVARKLECMNLTAIEGESYAGRA
ncbi:MAG: hypothetical protein ABSC45_02335 [Desulfobaccales bacterium]|jgi:hypothetical protein